MKECRQADPRPLPYPAARLKAEQGPPCPNARFERKVQAVATSMVKTGVIDAVKYPVAHIVEEVGGIDLMNEVEVPTEEYYEAFDLYLKKEFPGACPHVREHMVSLMAFLHKSIVSGFSFGIDKAQVLIIAGKLLGHMVTRSGAGLDPERSQAVMDFAPLKELLHVQQFLGCTNWLRVCLHAVYAHAAKIVGELQKEGTFFQKDGYGEKDTKYCKAIRAIKLMCKFHINLAVLDEAAAIDGSRPLEQIADSSGIAWGGALVQMSADMSTLKILAMVGKGLLPSQQAWPPLNLEGYAQLETKRAQRRILGTFRSIC